MREDLSKRERRIILFATVSGLAIAALVAEPSLRSARFVDFISPAHSAAAAPSDVQGPSGFADIVEKVKPAVVSVRVKMAESAQAQRHEDEDWSPLPGLPLERFFRRFGIPHVPHFRYSITGQGSGFFISADGYAVTNYHVVDKAKTVEVVTDDGSIHTAKVIGTDPQTDVALIKVDSRSDFPYVVFADKAPRVGDWVLAVGNPFGLGGTVTAGIVSASGRNIDKDPYDDFIQIDAPINKGNSGGPTFDIEGKVIGVNTAIYSPSGGSVGIGFAIPADTVKNVIDQLKEKGFVTRGWLGVQIQPVTSEIADSLGLKKAEGALVADVQSDSPAAKAGLKSGDVITAIDSTQIRKPRDLSKAVGGTAPNTSVTLKFLRNGTEQTQSLTLGEMPKTHEARAEAEESDTPKAELSQLGLTLAPAETVAGSGKEGLVVTDVDPASPAAERGIQIGDVILDVATNPCQPQWMYVRRFTMHTRRTSNLC